MEFVVVTDPKDLNTRSDILVATTAPKRVVNSIISTGNIDKSVLRENDWVWVIKDNTVTYGTIDGVTFKDYRSRQRALEELSQQLGLFLEKYPNSMIYVPRDDNRIQAITLKDYFDAFQKQRDDLMLSTHPPKDKWWQNQWIIIGGLVVVAIVSYVIYNKYYKGKDDDIDEDEITED